MAQRSSVAELMVDPAGIDDRSNTTKDRFLVGPLPERTSMLASAPKLVVAFPWSTPASAVAVKATCVGVGVGVGVGVAVGVAVAVGVGAAVGVGVEVGVGVGVVVGVGVAVGVGCCTRNDSG